MSPIHQFVSEPTYDGLVELMKIYMNRHDQDTLDAIPFFINCAEKVLLRNLRMPKMQKTVKFTMSESGNVQEGWMFLPKDYLEMKYVWIEGANANTLTRITFDQLIRLDGNGEDIWAISDNTNGFGHSGLGLDTCSGSTGGFKTSGPPLYWAINGDRMYIRPSCYPDQVIKMTYFADLQELSPYVNGGKSILLDLAPDALAYLALAEGFRFLMENERGDQFERFGTSRMLQIKQMQEDAEYSGSPLVVRPMG